MKAGFLNPLLSGGPFALQNSRNRRIIADRVETAFDSDTRKKGLMGRHSLAAGSALVIAPSNSVHTFFMRFPIDLLFVGRDGEVLKVRHSVQPWRLAGAWRAFAVVELPAGTAESAEVQPGDRLVLHASNPARFELKSVPRQTT
jgi:uncharacterized membrane protein (UPF0127 family)